MLKVGAPQLKELGVEEGDPREKKEALETRRRERRQEGPRKPSVFSNSLGVIWDRNLDP